MLGLQSKKERNFQLKRIKTENLNRRIKDLQVLIKRLPSDPKKRITLIKQKKSEHIH